MMNRRSNDANGWVNFPVNDPNWKNSREGGMFVKLVVCDNRDFDNQFGICTGVHVYDCLSEMLIGDDIRPQPAETYDPEASDEMNIEQMDRDIQNRNDWEAYHFPRMHETKYAEQTFCSRAYLAAIVMGSTGWSGWGSGDYWHCTYNDLTEEGKSLYNTIQKLYTGCTLHLLTFLDT